MDTFHIPLRAVFYRDLDDWIAHCLEFDLLGSGETKEDALQCLTEAISAQVEASARHGNPGNLFSPAPGEFFQKFASGSQTAVGNLEVCVKQLCETHPDHMVETIDVREYTDPQPYRRERERV